MNTVLTREPLLTAADRCERCNAAAMVRISTESLGDWLLCGHHSDQHVTAIPGVTTIHDERNPL